LRGEGRSPQSQEGDREDGHNDSDPGLTDPASTATPQGFAPEMYVDNVVEAPMANEQL
jgi:hypothetical protein